MNTKLIDPIKMLAAHARSMKEHASGTLPLQQSELPYEIPLVPPAGAQVRRLTIASTYRTPIPVLFDPKTRTTYPISSES